MDESAFKSIANRYLLEHYSLVIGFYLISGYTSNTCNAKIY